MPKTKKINKKKTSNVIPIKKDVIEIPKLIIGHYVLIIIDIWIVI